MRHRRALPLLAALLLAACSVFEPDYAGVVVRYRETEPLDRERLVVTLNSAGTMWYLEGFDLEGAEAGWLSSRELRIPPGGPATVYVALRGRGSEVAASGEITLPLPAHARWRLDVLPSSAEPAVVCGGCTGVARFPIRTEYRPSARDWLYLRWEELGDGPDAGRAPAGPIPDSRRSDDDGQP